MTKKTWVKLKRGLLVDPKHRQALGIRLWLYLYMLDIADWETGKVIDWQDKAVADELQMPLITIRTQRREIENAGYITCHQAGNHQVIVIKRWTNPREYSGKVYNTEGDNNLSPDEPEGDNNLSPSNIESDKGGDKGGTQNLSPLHIYHIPHNTLKELPQNDSEPFSIEPVRIPVVYANNEYVEVDEIKETKPKHGANYKSLMSAVASVCRMDIGIKTQAGQVGKAARELDEGGYTPDQVYDFLDWWKREDWRWQKEKRNPSPHEILTTISRSIVKAEPKMTDDELRRIGYIE
jgi:hypothetical protein